MAAAATPWTIDGDGVAFLEAHDAFAGSGHPTRVLMAKRKGRLEPEFFLHHVQIRVAYARATSRIAMFPLANSIASSCPSAKGGWNPTAVNRPVAGS